ncbi:MAG: OB-fold nucleic acid binding domain-containing protein, partial [Flavobacteriaceae bacterium]
MNNLLKTPIEYLKGIGPQRADLLKKELGIFSYEDFLHLFPNRYIDRTKYYKINQLQPTFNTEIQIVGKIIHLKVVEQKRGKRLVATFVDDTGQMELVWFQGYKWIKENLKINEPYVVFGKTNLVGGTFSMPHPEMDLLSDHKQNIQTVMQPVYPSTEMLTKKGISSRVIHKAMQQLF